MFLNVTILFIMSVLLYGAKSTGISEESIVRICDGNNNCGDFLSITATFDNIGSSITFFAENTVSSAKYFVTATLAQAFTDAYMSIMQTCAVPDSSNINLVCDCPGGQDWCPIQNPTCCTGKSSCAYIEKEDTSSGCTFDWWSGTTLTCGCIDYNTHDQVMYLPTTITNEVWLHVVVRDTTINGNILVDMTMDYTNSIFGGTLPGAITDPSIVGFPPEIINGLQVIGEHDIYAWYWDHSGQFYTVDLSEVNFPQQFQADKPCWAKKQPGSSILEFNPVEIGKNTLLTVSSCYPLDVAESSSIASLVQLEIVTNKVSEIWEQPNDYLGNPIPWLLAGDAPVIPLSTTRIQPIVFDFKVLNWTNVVQYNMNTKLIMISGQCNVFTNGQDGICEACVQNLGNFDTDFVMSVKGTNNATLASEEEGSTSNNKKCYTMSVPDLELQSTLYICIKDQANNACLSVLVTTKTLPPVTIEEPGLQVPAANVVPQGGIIPGIVPSIVSKGFGAFTWWQHLLLWTGVAIVSVILGYIVITKVIPMAYRSLNKQYKLIKANREISRKHNKELKELENQKKKMIKKQKQEKDKIKIETDDEELNEGEEMLERAENPRVRHVDLS